MQFHTYRCVGIPGLEPGMTGPESVVLPLHHIPIKTAFTFTLGMQYPSIKKDVHKRTSFLLGYPDSNQE